MENNLIANSIMSMSEQKHVPHSFGAGQAMIMVSTFALLLLSLRLPAMVTSLKCAKCFWFVQYDTPNKPITIPNAPENIENPEHGAMCRTEPRQAQKLSNETCDWYVRRCTVSIGYDLLHREEAGYRGCADPSHLSGCALSNASLAAAAGKEMYYSCSYCGEDFCNSQAPVKASAILALGIAITLVISW